MSADLTIGVLLPDVLGTYSDIGNAVVLAQRARWRGIDAEVLHLTATAGAPSAGCDLYLLGGGEDTAQRYAVSWLREQRGLLRALDTRATTLAVCAGMQILGNTMIDVGGRHHCGLGLLDLVTEPRRRRVVGEVIADATLPEVGRLTGFANHRGATTLAPGLSPLARVRSGIGNGAGAAVDGAVRDRIVATYLHGPVLARNPALADHLLRKVTGRALPEIELADQAELRRGRLAGNGRRSRWATRPLLRR